MTAIDIDALQAWVGRSETTRDTIAQAPVDRLSATLDYPGPRAGLGEPLPPLWHWLYFLSAPGASALDRDGHALRGGFLPPVPLPRRMWAGSRIEFAAPLRVGDVLRRESTVDAVEHKRGRSGDLVFVMLRHRILREDTLLLQERQQLVYRGASAPAAQPGQAAPAGARWSRTLTPDTVLLFRYSALTFNSHRIHYDRDYATSVEGYPALVVQGPLTATLLLDLLQRQLPASTVKSFEFRGLRPLFAGAPLQLQGCLEGKTARLWALDAGGVLAMTATAELM